MTNKEHWREHRKRGLFWLCAYVLFLALAWAVGARLGKGLENTLWTEQREDGDR